MTHSCCRWWWWWWGGRRGDLSPAGKLSLQSLSVLTVLLFHINAHFREEPCFCFAWRDTQGYAILMRRRRADAKIREGACRLRRRTERNKPSSPAYASQTSPPRRALMAQIPITRDARKAKAAERDGAAAAALSLPNRISLNDTRMGRASCKRVCNLRRLFLCACVYVFSSL